MLDRCREAIKMTAHLCSPFRCCERSWVMLDVLASRHQGEIQNFFYHQRLLLLFKLREHGQGNDFRGGLLCYGEVAETVLHPCVGFLQVQGNGVVNSGADRSLFEMVHQAFAICGSDDIQVIDRARPRGLAWWNQAAIYGL